MKNLLAGLLALAISTLGISANSDFWQQLTAEERAAAGLGTLSDAQQKKLNELAERFAREGARQAVEVAKVEAKEAVRAEVAQKIKESEKARIGLAANEAEEVVTSKISGTFRGWTGQTLFKLDNGQTWVQTDKSEVNWLPAQEGPEVEIRKSGIGGWKLQILPKGRWVRVKRVN